MRPGRTAFAKSPTENAEKTVIGFGCGGGIAERMTVVHASARTTTERRLNAIATTTHSQTTAVNASPIARKLGPRQMKSATTAAHEEDGERDTTRESTSAGGSGSRGGGLVDLDEPRSDRVPRVALLHQLAARGAHRRAARFVGEERDDGVR